MDEDRLSAPQDDAENSPWMEADPPEARARVLVGIGGWLILPAIGICRCVVTALIRLIRALMFVIEAGSVHWSQVLVLGIFALNLAFYLALAIFFFRKKIAFRRFYLASFALTLALLVVNLINGDFLPRDLLSLIAQALWMTYFYQSRRVANTFH